jgi:hypothetical protein
MWLSFDRGAGFRRMFNDIALIISKPISADLWRELKKQELVDPAAPLPTKETS